jgi:diaminopimelate epimerase
MPMQVSESNAMGGPSPDRFAKYEGLGNDFVILERDSDASLLPPLARRLCNRHFGIGADGVLLVLPPSNATAAARMVVLNADGTRPEMCGNGIRCVALHLARKKQASAATYVVETDSGALRCDVERDGDRALVSVEMGCGKLLGEHYTELDGLGQTFSHVSMGNPHAVVFDTRYEEAAIDRHGPKISSEIPGGCNIEFATTLGPRSFDLIVWERGVGRTLACGTGAAATAVAAALSGRAPFSEPILVRLPGGPLEVTVEPDTLATRIRGPARLVFVGEVVVG